MRLQTALLLWVAAFILLSSGCAVSPSAGREPGKHPIKIAAILSATGRTAFMGEPQSKTLVALQKEINDSGGLHGRPLEITVYDTQSTTDNALSAARAVAADTSYVALIGPSTTAETLTALPVLEQAKLPTLSLAAGQDIVNPVRPWIFKVAQSDAHAIGRIYDFLSRRDVVRVVVLYADDVFGRGGRKQLLEQAPGFGITVSSDHPFNTNAPDQTDLARYLQGVKKTPAQAIVVWGTDPGPSTIARLVRRLDLHQLLVSSHSIASREFLRQSGEAAEGVLFPASPLLVCESLPASYPQRPALIRFKQWYAAKCGGEASPFGGHAWDAMQLLRDAILAVGPDRAKIRAYLEETENFTGVAGTFHFSPADHNGLSRGSFVMIRVHQGTWVLQP